MADITDDLANVPGGLGRLGTLLQKLTDKTQDIIAEVNVVNDAVASIEADDNLVWTGTHSFAAAITFNAGAYITGAAGVDLIHNVVTGQSQLFKVNNVTVLTVAGALITAAQQISATSGITSGGNVIVTGTAQIQITSAGKIVSTSGNLNLDAPSGSSSVLKVNDVAVLTVGGALITAAQPIAAAAGTVAAPSITLGDSGTGFYRTALNEISGTINGSHKMKLDANGLTASVLIGTSGVKFAPSGSGSTTITFYETGTFSPTIIANGGGAATYDFQTGRYVRIGDLVWVDVDVSWSAHSGSDFLSVGAMPFTSSNDGTASYSGVIWPVNQGGITASHYVVIGLSPNSTTAFIRTFPVGPTTTPGVLDFDTSGELRFSMCYKAG